MWVLILLKMKKLIFCLAFFTECLSLSSQNKDTYQVYALNYTGNAYSAANNWAVGANEHDSIQYCAMVWLLKGGDAVLDQVAYVEAMKRMKRLVTDPKLIIPGHDAAVFTRFPLITDRIVKIGN